MQTNEWLFVAPQIQKTLAARKAVVALESTIIAHGLPYPENLEVARECERLIKENGAAPATVGVVGGRLVVGLSDAEIERLAREPNVAKANLSNLAPVIAGGGLGATSVSTTIRAASLAGIKVFVTGGIGGVHRGFAESFDISSDLTALESHSVLVVSAGAKAILDVRATLEQLETRGVPVIGYKTDCFPLFYTVSSPYRVDGRVESPEEAARVFRCHRAIFPQRGMLLANPIPKSAEIPADEINAAIERAQSQIASAGLKHGREVTPFLLAEIERQTGGRSLAANLALIKNNAVLGALVARAIEEI
ncbi:MAG: pseudouridine-5'-phosphate glycosidase [bacterium]